MWLIVGVAVVTLTYCIGICLESKTGIAAAKEILTVVMVYSATVTLSLLGEIRKERRHYERNTDIYMKSPVAALIKKILLGVLIFLLSMICYFLSQSI